MGERSEGGEVHPTIFVRQASGLVREIGLLDAFVLNYGWTGASFSLTLAFMISQAMWAYPGGDFSLAQLLTMVLVLVGIALPYAMLSMAMPRAGGDYVFNSRILHPAVGFVASFGMMMMLSFFVAWGVFWGGAQATASMLANLGHVLGVPALVRWGEAIASTNGAFVFGTLLIAGFSFVVWQGLRWFVIVNRILLAVGIVGALAALVVLLVSSPSEFRTAFNDLMREFSRSPDYYGAVVAQAREAGYSTGFSLSDTVAILPIVAFSSIFSVASSYMGSEVKDPGRTQLLGMGLALVVLAVMNIAVYALLVRVTGKEFLGATQFLWYEGTLPDLPLNPFFNLFVLVLTGSPVLMALIGLGYAAMSVLFVPQNILVNSRMIFAWTFDRVLPEAFAKVDPKRHSPVVATIAVALISEVFLVIFAYTQWLATLGATFLVVLVFLCTALAAVLFPWRAPRVFQASPVARWRVGGVPLICVFGAVGVVYCAALLVSYLVNDRYLVNSPAGLAVIGAVLVVAIVIYAVARAVRRRQGFDLRLAFAELPPD